MSGDLRLMAHQFRYDVLSVWRNPQSRIFTLVLPLIFLYLFVSILGNGDIDQPGGAVSQATYFVPNMACFGLIGAAFVNLTVAVTIMRESGIFKRRRTTPVPLWVVVVGRTLTQMIVALAISVVLLAIGVAFYDVEAPWSTLPAVLVTILVGSLSFCCLAFAVSTFIGSADAAIPIAQVASLPLYFISGIFFPDSMMPKWITHVADVFPVRHLTQALLTCFNPHTHGSGFATGHLLILLAWAAAGVLIATRRFSWSARGA